MSLVVNLNEKIKSLNCRILSTSWKDTDLTQCNFDSNTQYCNSLSKEQNNLISEFINYIPEWNRILGCKQHNIHDFTLDIHTLTVVKYVQNHKDYDALCDEDKLVLMYSAFLHDIAKNEGEVDKAHPSKGAELAKAILGRLKFQEEFVNDVYLMIKYHQVLGFTISEKVHYENHEFPVMFPTERILDLQAILSVSDIKSVKKDEGLFKAEMDEKIELLKKKIKNLLGKNEK
jgi:UTP:GlnB (protein PII) uridylyltransferase